MTHYSFIALLAVASCTPGPVGPQGSQGPQGPQGARGSDGAPSSYSKRSDIYCNERQGLFVADGGVGAVSRAGFMTVSCDNAADLPLFANCDGVYGDDVHLESSRPQTRWDDATDGPARWGCAWSFSGTATPHDLPFAAGRICCIRKP